MLAPVDPDPSAGAKHSKQVLASFRNDATTSLYSGVPSKARPRLKAKAERRIINPPINLLLKPEQGILKVSPAPTLILTTWVTTHPD